MATEQQLSLPFACLDFPGRGAVCVWEIAAKLGCSDQHILNLIDDGTLHPLDLTRRTGSRRMLRIPVDEYRAYVVSRLNGATRTEFIAELPHETLREIAAAIAARLAA